MIARVAVTGVMLLLAFAAYFSPSGCDNCQQHLGAPFGIFFVVVAAIAWFKWEVISEGFYRAKNEKLFSMGRLSLMDIRGLASLLRHGRAQRRSSSEP